MHSQISASHRGQDQKPLFVTYGNGQPADHADAGYLQPNGESIHIRRINVVIRNNETCKMSAIIALTEFKNTNRAQLTDGRIIRFTKITDEPTPEGYIRHYDMPIIEEKPHCCIIC